MTEDTRGARYIAGVSTSRAVPSRRSLIAAAALVVWVVVLIFGWAVRPIDDTVPVVVDPTSELAVTLAAEPSATPSDAPRAQLVECNSLLDGAARDLSAPLPTLRDDYIYSRTPCTDPHSDARLAAAVNVLAVIAIIGGWIWVARRTSPQPASPASDPILA